MAVLAAALRERPGPVGRFLRVVLDQDRPGVSAAVAAGIPHWDATPLLRRLAEAGEVGPAGWAVLSPSHWPKPGPMSHWLVAR